MEDSSVQEKERGVNGSEKTSSKSLMSDKPLHRFLVKEPRSFGVALLIFGCAELSMGFTLAGQKMHSSNDIYIPFWQGALFITCGILSICADSKPSKKTVTISLALYIVSILGNLVSFGYRIYFFILIPFLWYRQSRSYYMDNWVNYRYFQLMSIEVVLFLSSICVFGILIFLSTIARFGLKSSHTQIIVNYVPQQVEPRSDPTPD